MINRDGPYFSIFARVGKIGSVPIYLVPIFLFLLLSPAQAALFPDSGNRVLTGDWDFGGGGLEIENGTAPPACTVGQIFLDTDATSGQQLYGCEGGTFVLQGDGGAAGNIKYNNLANPIKEKNLLFTSFTNSWTTTATSTDFFTIANTANFNDVSLLNLTQITGTPTDGTVLELVATDADVDTFRAGDGVSMYFKIDSEGRIYHKGSAPAPSSCGTSPSVTGSDTAGVVSVGSGTVTACTITFANAFEVAPRCVITGSLTSIIYFMSTAPSTTAFTFSSSATMGSTSVYYVCMGG